MPMQIMRLKVSGTVTPVRSIKESETCIVHVIGSESARVLIVSFHY